MKPCSNLLAILEELSENAKRVNGEEVDTVKKLISEAKRVFVAGAGRSGFAARGFANRLMHLGYSSYFVGEPTTPSIQQGDLLIIGSGSGETASLKAMAQKAVEQGAKLATLTIFPSNTIGSMAAACIKIPGITSKVEEEGDNAKSIQTKGSSFEQLSWLIYDSIIIDLKRETGQTDADMFARHANLE
ncbi:6-phospho-3-hexuloisomerase [Paenibacillus sp. FSL W8-0186]|uniref:6-phospho-3-hexuloisomerase n=1 Tax=Paenibacillus woosongensis TaxID=307580 RepID=A0ABQ4MUL5_9BACL|nr:6-phospho-3-hexuloisomerase [Paenibacillus woosongensis]GIP59613.1 6-phospho-3-hexuloisomerase [Paenibacillus woosongensis]